MHGAWSRRRPALFTGRSDVASLAKCVLYEMLTGDPPTRFLRPRDHHEDRDPGGGAGHEASQERATGRGGRGGEGLEKLPADRFDSARAFAYALAVSGVPGARATGMAGAGPAVIACDVAGARRDSVGRCGGRPARRGALGLAPAGSGAGSRSSSARASSLGPTLPGMIAGGAAMASVHLARPSSTHGHSGRSEAVDQGARESPTSAPPRRADTQAGGLRAGAVVLFAGMADGSSTRTSGSCGWRAVEVLPVAMSQSAAGGGYGNAQRLDDGTIEFFGVVARASGSLLHPPRTGGVDPRRS